MSDALVSAGLAVAFVAVALAVVALATMLTERPPTPIRPSSHEMTRRAFLVIGAVATGAAFASFLGLVRLRGFGLAPRASGGLPPIVTRRSRPAALGLWIPPDELGALPIDLPAFERLRAASAERIPADDVSNQDSDGPRSAMGTALVAARLDDGELRSRVRDALLGLIGTEDGDTHGHPERNRRLGVGRNLAGYVIAADLIGLRDFDPSADGRFRSWIDQLRTKRVNGADASLAEAEPHDHSNWGAYGSASMTAMNLYLGDVSATQDSAGMLRGWLGEADARQDWVYDTERHDYSWECHFPDVSRYLPVNPAGCARDGLLIDGIIPVDMQRGAGFRVPPIHTRYPRESLQGRSIQAELLHRAGFDSFTWGDAGLRRVAERLAALAEAFDPAWYEPEMGCYWIIAARTGAPLTLEAPSTGRSVAGIDWTFG